MCRVCIRLRLQFGQHRRTRRFRTRSCFDRLGAVSPYLNGRFELFALLDNPTGVFCSNGLPGVNKDDICCEAQCGDCGGPGCGGRPSGSVRWCLCRFRLLPWPLISLAFSEACSFVRPGARKRGKIAGTQSLTSRLASGWQENVH